MRTFNEYVIEQDTLKSNDQLSQILSQLPHLSKLIAKVVGQDPKMEQAMSMMLNGIAYELPELEQAAANGSFTLSDLIDKVAPYMERPAGSFHHRHKSYQNEY